MSFRNLIALLLFVAAPFAEARGDEATDPARDILVTFENKGVRAGNSGLAAPYSHRKRYSISRAARRNAAAVKAEHHLVEIEHWPIRSLSVYCFVYRVPEGVSRALVIDRLRADRRVESVQALHRFDTSVGKASVYDDTYANLQYGLNVLDISAAHRTSTGTGVRVGIVDSQVDKHHEDLRGRIKRIKVFSPRSRSADIAHGTAVASIIGARSNNARGIVGIAPEATIELYVACWHDGASRKAICDSFTLLRALDSMLDDPPQILNLSLIGPHDPLLERVLTIMLDSGVIVVAAGASADIGKDAFPSSMDRVIGVMSSPQESTDIPELTSMLYAPGHQIMVAIPRDKYDFRSGSSLAAAHVSGVVALLLSQRPHESSDSVRSILTRSQYRDEGQRSINACIALVLAGLPESCGGVPIPASRTEF